MNALQAIGQVGVGNVSEWTSDWYSADWYDSGEAMGPDQGTERATRGGNWRYGPDFARATRRSHASPDTAQDWLGFRCAAGVGD